MSKTGEKKYYRLSGIFMAMELLRPQATWEMSNDEIVKWDDPRPKPTKEEIKKVQKLAQQFEDEVKPIFLPEQIEKMESLQRHENPDIEKYIRN